MIVNPKMIQSASTRLLRHDQKIQNDIERSIGKTQTGDGITLIKDNRIQAEKNPLKNSVSTQPSFKGFFNAIHYTITPNLHKKTLDILETISADQAKLVKKYIKEFVQELRADPAFMKKLHYTQEQVEQMAQGNLFSLPKENLPIRFTKAALEPFTNLKENVHKFVLGQENPKIQHLKKQEEILTNYSEVNGLFKSINKWENQYRKRYGVAPMNGNESFFIPENLLQGNIHRRQFEALNPNKGQYSTKTLSVGNRIVSGIIGSTMYGIDAYNTTMYLSNDKGVSSKEGKIKFLQQMIRISLAAYFTGIALGAFQSKTNRSLKNALLVSSGMVLLSEVLGRKLVGKYILPTTKEKMEDRDKKNENSKNPFLKIEKLLGSKKAAAKVAEKTETTQQTIQQAVPAAIKPQQTAFSGNNNNISFGKKLPKMFSSVRIDNLFDVLDEINPELGEYFEKLIKKNISITTKLDASKSLREITKTTQEIPVGRFEPYADKAAKAFFLPFYWVKNLFMNLKKFLTKKLHPQKLSDEVRVNAKALRDKGLWNIYSQRLKEMQSSEMWKMPSTMSKEQRINALMKEVLHINGEAFRNEISGVKHTLLWLENEVKQFKKDFGTEDVDAIISKIMENKDNPDYQKYLGKIKSKLNRKSLDACARDKADYDTSVYSTANLFIGRLLSTMFLVFDTYNLTMLHSNNNRLKANENGANYAAQEINRTFISTYLIGLTNTIFRTFHNASLWGALSLTALTNSSVQFLSRYSVGKPVTPKSQEELIEMDEKAKKANNPFLKIIAKGLGKNTHKIDYGQAQKTSLKDYRPKDYRINFTNGTFKDFLPQEKKLTN